MKLAMDIHSDRFDGTLLGVLFDDLTVRSTLAESTMEHSCNESSIVLGLLTDFSTADERRAIVFSKFSLQLSGTTYFVTAVNSDKAEINPLVLIVILYHLHSK